MALCSALGEWLAERLGPRVSVSVVKHPTDRAVPAFDLAAYTAAPTLIHIGWHLRNQDALAQAPVPAGVRKVHVRRGFQWELEAAEQMRRAGPFRARPPIGQTDLVGALEPADYDALLSRSVILAEMIGAAASNTVVEAIARGTPILVTPLPAIVEYLGPDYPGYVTRLEDVPALLAPASVRAIADYLVGMDRSWLDGRVFAAAVSAAVAKAVKRGSIS